VLRAIAAAPSVVRVEALPGRRAGQAFGRAKQPFSDARVLSESCRALGAVSGGACPGEGGEDDDRNGARAHERTPTVVETPGSRRRLSDLVGRLCPNVKVVRWTSSRSLAWDTAWPRQVCLTATSFFVVAHPALLLAVRNIVYSNMDERMQGDA
jgi:hypothetical protein